MRITGHYENNYFIPEPLPPQNPPFKLSSEIAVLYGEAMHEIGKLNGLANNLPDIHRFIKAYVIKEALLSSAIEGIYTTLLDIFTQPFLESKPSKDTQLVMNYTKALKKALDLIKKENFPISSRVVLAAHKALMETGEGDKSDPGHFRKQAVRVGALIPPPPLQVPQLMSDLEHYINTDETVPPLIKAGLAHVQFETIHPFLDGNGRIGRLLIVLMLIENGLLQEPILYPSYYFKKNQLEYYQCLDRVRTHGDFEGWITFYLKTIKYSSIDAYKRGKEIENLQKKSTTIILQEETSDKVRDNRLKTLTIIFSCPVITIKELSLQIGMSYNTAHQIIADFITLGFLVEETEQKRGKLFKFKPYIDILEKDHE